MVAILLNLMDGNSRTDGMLDSIDPALRRPGKLGRET
jgi:SpoVK/Ycf46/Vps4 family AAA+-type ATPase